MSVCTGIASLLCSVFLASTVYEAHIADGGVNCTSSSNACYRDTFLALGGLCLAAVVAAWILVRRRAAVELAEL